MNKLNQEYKVVFLEGDKLLLRPLEEKDINEKYLSWLNDREVIKYLDVRVFPAVLEDLHAFYRRIRDSKTDILLAIVDKASNEHIGNIKLGNIDWIHRYAEMAILLGDKRYWGKGHGLEASQLILEYAFDRLNLNKVILCVYASHKTAIKIYQKLGFQIEGRLKKIFNLDGKYVDNLWMGILRSEFKSRKNLSCILFGSKQVN